MFFNTGAGTGAVGSAACVAPGPCMPFTARMALWPDNNAHAVSGVLGADLPWKSRYTGSYTYTMMRQNEAFLPYTSNPFLTAGTNSTSALPYSSLDGQINTLLINNAVTTQITSDLKSKLSYRYYDYQNDTTAKLFNNTVGTDYTSTTGTRPNGTAMGISPYKKQNAGAELTWRPLRSLTTGIAYGFERYEWDRNDVDTTNEHAVKLYSNYRVTDWMSTRASYQYSARRYETYTNTIATGNWNTNYRNPELADRDQQRGKYQLDFEIAPALVVSPFAGFQLRDYGTDPWGAKTLGVLKDELVERRHRNRLFSRRRNDAARLLYARTVQEAARRRGQSEHQRCVRSKPLPIREQWLGHQPARHGEYVHGGGEPDHHSEQGRSQGELYLLDRQRHVDDEPARLRWV